jgi:hypothetical protein
MLEEMPVHPMDRELPRFSLRQEELPEVREWKVNGEHYIILKVEMVGKRNTKAIGVNDSRDKEKIEGTFQVLKIKALGDKPVDLKSLEREDFNKVYVKARSGK